MPITFDLTKPIQGHPTDGNPEGKITKLQLRDLTARDLVKFKSPPITIVRLAEDQIRIEQNYPVVMQYLSELSGVDEITLGSMAASDLNRASDVIASMLNGDAVKN